MTHYTDANGYQMVLPSIFVHEEDKRAKVTYSNGQEKFSVIVRKRPNPIGFTAKLPGSRNK